MWLSSNVCESILICIDFLTCKFHSQCSFMWNTLIWWNRETEYNFSFYTKIEISRKFYKLNTFGISAVLAVWQKEVNEIKQTRLEKKVEIELKTHGKLEFNNLDVLKFLAVFADFLIFMIWNNSLRFAVVSNFLILFKIILLTFLLVFKSSHALKYLRFYPTYLLISKKM